MANTRIEWAEKTWNPITGCTKISESCQNCYAERMSKRLAGRCGYPKDNPFQVVYHSDKIDDPLRWRKPSRIFVCSMGDLFHEDVPEQMIGQVWNHMRLAPWHIYMILTKRPGRMKDFFIRITNTFPNEYPAPYIWLGVTAENQQRADERIPILLQTPAAVRFVSVEPTLGPVDLTNIPWAEDPIIPGDKRNALHEIWDPAFPVRLTRHKLDWVICGTESGPKRRPAQIEWIRSVKNQCVSAGVPFFLKQMEVEGKLVKMPELDGREWNEFPEVMP